MAQRIVLALFALFGFANAQILVSYGGPASLLDGSGAQNFDGLTSPVDSTQNYGGEGSTPQLGTQVVLGSPVTLGDNSNSVQTDVNVGQHNDGGGFVALNYTANNQTNTETQVVNDNQQQQDGQAANTNVNIPVFGNLKYAESNNQNEATKAPITIVTAPLVSTASTT